MSQSHRVPSISSNTDQHCGVLDKDSGLRHDARLCTRRSMPTLFESVKEHSAIVQSVQTRVQCLMEVARQIKIKQCSAQYVSSSEEAQYSEAVSEIASLIMKHVKPNAPHDIRKLFAIEDPPAQWLLRSKRTCFETFAWLDERAVKDACFLEIDVARNSSPPSK